MCRFLLYKGHDPILLADLLTRPAHSIINQAFDCRLRVDQRRPLNGDGFGVGWYEHQPHQSIDLPSVSSSESAAENSSTASAVVHQTTQDSSSDAATEENLVQMPCKDLNLSTVSVELDLMSVYTAKDGPCVFTSTLPAWNNLNLIRLSEKIRSPLVFAHVRAASPGFPVAETNCHPWSFGKFLWMHNGFVAQFRKIKRKLQANLREELYHFVQGSTDSEWTFALFLNQLDDPRNGVYTAEDLKNALLKTISLLNKWSREAGITELSLLNFAVSDGHNVVCTRYVNSRTAEPASLFYSSGSRFEETCNGTYKMIKSDKRENLIIISSEPLSYERTDWIPAPPNTVLIVSDKLNLLVYPIMDEFYSEKRQRTALPMDPAAMFSPTSPKVSHAVWG